MDKRKVQWKMLTVMGKSGEQGKSGDSLGKMYTVMCQDQGTSSEVQCMISRGQYASRWGQVTKDKDKFLRGNHPRVRSSKMKMYQCKIIGGEILSSDIQAKK